MLEVANAAHRFQVFPPSSAQPCGAPNDSEGDQGGSNDGMLRRGV